MKKEIREKLREDRLCKYCESATALKDPDEMLCQKRGVVSVGYCCRNFRYDLLKRDPGKAPKLAPLLEDEIVQI